jgi:hypothetical protein
LRGYRRSLLAPPDPRCAETAAHLPRYTGSATARLCAHRSALRGYRRSLLAPPDPRCADAVAHGSALRR